MAVNIKLVDNWRLLSEPNNVMIGREENGRMIIEGYYTSFENAIKSFVEMKIRGFDSSSLLALNNSIKSLQKACIKSLQGLNLPLETSKKTSLWSGKKNKLSSPLHEQQKSRETPRRLKDE